MNKMIEFTLKNNDCIDYVYNKIFFVKSDRELMGNPSNKEILKATFRRRPAHHISYGH